MSDQSTRIVPVLLAGGIGTRLWPLSRESYPKQFAQVSGNESLLQAAARLTCGHIGGHSFARPIVLTNSDFRFIITKQLSEIGIDPGAILLEPEGRNTGPAILAAALYQYQLDPDAILLVAPSDQIIPDIARFHEAVDVGLKAISDGKLVTFGISPTRPETGYGYLKLSRPDDGSGGAIPLDRFVEKPDVSRAEALISEGNALWNSGIFLFKAADVIDAFKENAAHLIPPVQKALDLAKVDLGFLRLAPEPWQKAKTISIDYAVMEHATNLSVVPFGGHWTDLGDWRAVWQESQRDEHGVSLSGTSTAIDCEASMLRSENPNLELVGIGLENIAVVAMTDAVLVTDLSKSQDVRGAVGLLRDKKAAQANQFPIHHRPWGWFESLVVGDRFQVKRIHVNPGAALSLQSHYHRSEHWVVVEGTARVTVEGTERLLAENQSAYIPIGATHRLENPGKVPMILIEIQTGSYIGEDDIVRYEDRYARDEGTEN